MFWTVGVYHRRVRHDNTARKAGLKNLPVANSPSGAGN
jgi:hypothetical protein